MSGAMGALFGRARTTFMLAVWAGSASQNGAGGADASCMKPIDELRSEASAALSSLPLDRYAPPDSQIDSTRPAFDPLTHY